MKKYISFLLLTLLFAIFINGNPVKANESSIIVNQEDKQTLINLGFTEDEISNMDQEEFDQNKFLEGEVVAENTKFYKVIEVATNDVVSSPYQEKTRLSVNSPDEQKDSTTSIELDEKAYWEELAKDDSQNLTATSNKSIGTLAYTPGTHKTSYKTLTTTIVKLSSSKFRVKTSITWHKMPSNRKIDVIGTAVNSAYWAPDISTQYGKQNWVIHHYCTPNTSHSATYSSSSTKWKKGASGYALLINLPDTEVHTNACISTKLVSLSGYSYYTATKLGTTSQIDAYGEYAHQEKTIQINPSVTFYPASFGISASMATSFTNSSTHARYTY